MQQLGVQRAAAAAGVQLARDANELSRFRATTRAGRRFIWTRRGCCVIMMCRGTLINCLEESVRIPGCESWVGRNWIGRAGV